MLLKSASKKIDTKNVKSHRLVIFHKYAYIYTIELIGDNRYIIP